MSTTDTNAVESLGTPIESVTVRPDLGGYVTAQPGDLIRITDLEGKQVGDLTAVATETQEWLSPCHTRQVMSAMKLHLGDCLCGHWRTPLLRLVSDDVGQHDLLFAACDKHRYQLDFGISEHASCVDNINGALARAGIQTRPFEPVNLFMNFTYDADGRATLHEPLSQAGDAVVFEVLVPVVVALSACPQDHTPCNGWHPTDLLLERFAPANGIAIS